MLLSQEYSDSELALKFMLHVLWYFLNAGIDREALDLALQFENACNDYLRGAAVNYLSILVDNGLIPPRDVGQN